MLGHWDKIPVSQTTFPDRIYPPLDDLFHHCCLLTHASK